MIEKFSVIAPQTIYYPGHTFLEDRGPFSVAWAGEEGIGESQALNNRPLGMKCSLSDSQSLEKSISPRLREEWTVIHAMKCLYVWEGQLGASFPSMNNNTSLLEPEHPARNIVKA